MDTWVGTAQEPENANSESSGGKVMAELEYELPQEPVGMSKGQIACHAERAPAGENSMGIKNPAAAMTDPEGKAMMGGGVLKAFNSATMTSTMS